MGAMWGGDPGAHGMVCRRPRQACRVGTPSFPGAPLTEPDLWASHPALRDAGVRGTQSPYSGIGIAARSYPSFSAS